MTRRPRPHRGMLRVASVHAAQAPGGSHASSSWSVSWHNRARRNDASHLRGQACLQPVPGEKSPPAGLASSQQWRQSTG